MPRSLSLAAGTNSYVAVETIATILAGSWAHHSPCDGRGGDAPGFTDRIHKAFAPLRQSEATSVRGILSMSISSIPASPPVTPPYATTTPKAPDVQADKD